VARLFDYILADQKRLSKFRESNLSLPYLSEAEVIVADNVMAYFLEHNKDGKFAFITEFPNIAPPFRNFFVQYRLPAGYQQHGTEFGVHVIALRINPQADNPDYVVDFLEAHKKAHGKDIHWMLMCHLWRYAKDHVEGLQHHIAFAVDAEGNALILDPINQFMLYSEEEPHPDDKMYIHSTILNMVYPVFLTISFLHCKNVSLEQQTPPAPLSKKFQKKYGRPLVRYHTLNIEPMRQVLKHEGQSEQTGLKRALHLCRGHFKDYSKGNGLFGKYKGLYWWDSNVRGSVSEGIVDKDYKVKPPRSE
jgi:hypothetical protein